MTAGRYTPADVVQMSPAATAARLNMLLDVIEGYMRANKEHQMNAALINHEASRILVMR